MTVQRGYARGRDDRCGVRVFDVFTSAFAVLRRRRIARVFRVGQDAARVVPEHRPFDRELSSGVRPRVAERVVFHHRTGDARVAFLARPEVHARVVEARGVDVVPGAFRLVAGEDAVAAVEPGVIGSQVRPEPAMRAHFARVGASVPPDLVAALFDWAFFAGVEVAHREVFDPHVVRLVDFDPVARFVAAVQDHLVAVHAPDPDPGLGGRDFDLFVVHARFDQDVVPRGRGVHRGLDGREVMGVRRIFGGRRALTDDVHFCRLRGARRRTRDDEP